MSNEAPATQSEVVVDEFESHQAEAESSTTESFLKFWNSLGENILNQASPEEISSFMEGAIDAKAFDVSIDAYPAKFDTSSSYLDTSVDIDHGFDDPAEVD